MTIHELLILPPFAIGRLGSAEEPLANYTIEENADQPLAFRRIVGAETLIVDEVSGEIVKTRVPTEEEIYSEGFFKEFPEGESPRIRPVAPFLEVFARTGTDRIEPLTLELLAREGLSAADVSWRVEVANRKIVRRTADEKDLIHAKTGWFSDHSPHELKGHCEHFVSKQAHVAFGSARYIRPSKRFSGIRLRFTPAKGLIYGPRVSASDKSEADRHVIPKSRAIYGSKGKWVGFDTEVDAPKLDAKNFPANNETLPPALYAIVPPAPTWLHNNVAVSRGYFDDACDGIVEVRLKLSKGKRKLTARARVCAGPPAVVPDALFVRSLADDLDQVIHGPDVPDDEKPEVTRARAEDILRRAFETVRFMNVAVMNGNDFDGRDALLLDSMPEEQAADTQRAIRPVMSPTSVDTLAVTTLHGQVLTALKGGAKPWFYRLLRHPEEIGDYTDEGRRKMPALMCGADNGYLALTRRQIDTIRKLRDDTGFDELSLPEGGIVGAAPDMSEITPRNLSAQVHYAAAGNPISSRPVSSVANCCPGLEVDFRAVWRRMFKGLVLREYDSLVVEVDKDVEDKNLLKLAGHRLLAVRRLGTPPHDPKLPKGKQKKRFPRITLVAQLRGPAASDVEGSIVLTTKQNPEGVTPMEWSNALARTLRECAGEKVLCYFTEDECWGIPQACRDNPKNYVTHELYVRHFFEEGSGVISETLAKPGELTQGLCSPWQNDYRECSCYYWASARPDFVNIEPSDTGLSVGDNWFQKERTGKYVPDDYVDSRLVDYDDLFERWEHWLRFQIGGRDAPGEDRD